jgi:hypothetical protein
MHGRDVSPLAAARAIDWTAVAEVTSGGDKRVRDQALTA